MCAISESLNFVANRANVLRSGVRLHDNQHGFSLRTISLNVNRRQGNGATGMLTNSNPSAEELDILSKPERNNAALHS
jgi:hypothetical protein